MTLAWPDIAVYLLVAAAALYVLWRAGRVLFAKSTNGCGSCGSCPGDERQLVSLDGPSEHHRTSP